MLPKLGPYLDLRGCVKKEKSKTFNDVLNKEGGQNWWDWSLISLKGLKSKNYKNFRYMKIQIASKGSHQTKKL